MTTCRMETEKRRRRIDSCIPSVLEFGCGEYPVDGLYQVVCDKSRVLFGMSLSSGCVLCL